MPKTIEAPYVETDKRMLGDTHLSPQESVFREREKCLKDASKFRLYKQDELEDPERALGPRLQYTEFVSRLRRILPEMRFLDGSEGNIALYVPRRAEDYLATLREWDYGMKGKDDKFFQFHRYVGGFPKQPLPEFSTVDIDTSLLPTRERRGWRSVLIALIKQGNASYADAVAEFGDVGTDRRGWRWSEQLLPWKIRPNTKFKNETQENQ